MRRKEAKESVLWVEDLCIDLCPRPIFAFYDGHISAGQVCAGLKQQQGTV